MRPEARVGTVFEEWRLEALLDAGRVAATYTAARFRPRWPDSTKSVSGEPGAIQLRTLLEQIAEADDDEWLHRHLARIG